VDRGGVDRGPTWEGERVARRRLGFWVRFAVAVVKPSMLLLTRREWRGAEQLPPDGGLIIVVNHVSHADPLVVAHFVYDAGRWPQFLGKRSVFNVPVIGWLLHKVRQIPVQRGSTDAGLALDAAVAAVKAGDSVVIYPEGTTTKHPDLWPMRGKTGVARLWLATGAPVVPIVTWGPQSLFDPRTAKLRLRPRTPVTVLAGPPIDLSRFENAAPTAATLHEITDAVMDRLAEMLAEVRGGTPPPLWSSTGRERS
jgi:1-acyl-sn-glycerol-3-phosphate acyltransferase